MHHLLLPLLIFTSLPTYQDSPTTTASTDKADAKLWREVPREDVPNKRALPRWDSPESLELTEERQPWAFGLGTSVAAIHSAEPSRDEVPLIAFGLPDDGPGSVWFFMKTGVDPTPFTLDLEDNSGLGFRIEPIDDLDDDGVSDLIVLASHHDSKARRGYVVSTMKRSILHEWTLPSSMIGHAVEVCAIPESDGAGAIAVMGFISSNWPEPGRALVQVRSLASGELVHEFSSPAEDNSWSGRGAGRSQLQWIQSLGLASPGFLLSSIPETSRKPLRGIALPSGQVEWREAQESSARFSARSIAVGADIDGDGARELWIGDVAESPTGNGMERGEVRVLSGTTGELLFGVRGMDADMSHGICVHSYPDQNGDGVADMLVTDAWPLFSSRLLTLSGRDGSVLAALHFNRDFWRLGEFLEVGMDWDGKGLPDVIVSNYNPESGTQHGAHAIGIVSMEGGRLLHYIRPREMVQLLAKRDAASQRR